MRGVAADSHHPNVLQAIPEQLHFYILLLFAIEIPLRGQLLPSEQAQRFCAKGYSVPSGELLRFFTSFMALFDLQIQAAARRKVMPRRDVFPHTSLSI